MQESQIFRKCCVCNSLLSRDKLIKITKSKSGEIMVMPHSKFFGHSFYLCKNSQCVEGAFKKGKIFKLLKLSPDDSFKEKIRTVLES